VRVAGALFLLVYVQGLDGLAGIQVLKSLRMIQDDAVGMSRPLGSRNIY
jgi:hypothetical protein